jgi:hypothetical protein
MDLKGFQGDLLRYLSLSKKFFSFEFEVSFANDRAIHNYLERKNVLQHYLIVSEL